MLACNVRSERQPLCHTLGLSGIVIRYLRTTKKHEQMPTIEETQAWVHDLHHGQTDKAGQPYVDHVLRVHSRLLSLFPDASADVEHAALLHDAIEDCDVTADNLRRRGYSDAKIRIVEAVTKRPDGEQT